MSINNNVASKAANISPSLTLAITSKAKQLKASGVSIIGFGAGEPDFNTPQYIVDAAHEALKKGFTKYTAASGTEELKNAIKKKLKTQNNLDYETNQIIISNGAKHSLFNAMYTIIEDGDEVILPSPYWLTYPELVKMCGGVNVIVKTQKENGFKITPEQLEGAITPRTKAFILNSPNNPTGAVYSKEEIAALTQVILKYGIYVISDEIYEDLVYGCEHFSIASISKEMQERTILINGLSKTYSMTGWRIGYMAAPLHIAKAAAAVQSHMTSNPNSIAQYASCEALTNPAGREFIAQMVSTFDERRKYIVKRINEIKDLGCITPCGAFYVMLNISRLFGKKTKQGIVLNGSMDVAESLLNYGVAIVPCIAFGDDNYLRLSYAISMEDIKEGLNRIEKFVNDME